MWRNREFKWYVVVLVLVMLITTGMSVFLFTPQVAAFLFSASSLVVICSILFTRWRYKQIAKLSNYLRKISSGDYSLDIRDNHEGELSILKNEIFKVTLMLSEHSSHLQEDKRKLTNAISDISHQLKTPLTSMMMMSDLLSDTKLSEAKREEFTHNIRTQLERIEWLVASLLKLSKIDAGTAIFKKDKILLVDLIQKALGSVLIPIDIKQQTLKVIGDENITFTGDLNWTAEALINILKNCIEHTPEGGEISISYSENPLFTEITIEDNGKGIARDDLPYIFKRFYKGKNAGEDSVGIGLAMAHSIITSQAGDLSVTSEIGKGSAFHLKFYKQVI